MTGIWLVLLKAEVLLFAIGAVVVLIAGIINIVLEYRERKQNAAEPEEKKDILETAITEQTGGGIVTECSASKRCAAVTGILELEREREQLRKEYDELRERYKNLQAAYEGQREDFEDLEKDYRALDESNNKLISEHEELKKENEAHWRQLTQIMRSNPEVFEQFSGEDESEQELIDNGYVVK